MRRSISSVANICLMLLWAACGQSLKVNGGHSGSDGTGLVSDVPPESLSWPGDGDGDGDENESGDGDGGDEGAVNDASRVVEEADLVQVHGDRLFVMSQIGGLSIVDIGDPTNLRVLGRYPSDAIPFAMYVDGNRIIAMYWPWYSREPDAFNSPSSRVLVLDASDPAAIVLQAEIIVPGTLSESRRVGNLLYIVSNEDGSCWGCDDGSRTRVVSFDLSELPDPRVVDEVAFSNNGWHAPVTVTDQDMFVATRDTSDSDVEHSRIQVIDISDPAGTMRLGSTIDTAGVIRSAWQMDEYENVLRVISQGHWQEGERPVVETFAIASSDELMELGSTELWLPLPESLRSVRFDGDRGFVLMSERTGSLLTIDLSKPAMPSQGTVLELAGSIEHMESRGDRVVAIGYSDARRSGQLDVSLLDVRDLAAPKLLSHENFGGKHGSLGNVQDRLQKVISVDDEAGVILVSFASYEEECVDPISGIQLVELRGDELHVGPVAQTFGYAARGFMLGERLVALCSERMQVYDVQDGAAPAMISQASLAFTAAHFTMAGDRVVGLAESRVSSKVSLTVAGPANLNPLTRPLLDLSTDAFTLCRGANGVVATETTAFIRGLQDWTTIVDLTEGSPPRELLTTELPDATLAVGEDALVGIRHDSFDLEGELLRTLDVIDVRDRQNPFAATLDLRRGVHLSEMFARGKLLFTQSEEHVGDGRARYFLETVDLSDPGNPRLISTINVPGRVIHVLDSEHVLTIQTERTVIEDLEAEECIYGHLGLTEHQLYDESEREGLGTCSTFKQTMHKVRLGADEAIVEASVSLAPDGLIVSKAFGPNTALFIVARAIALAQNDYHVITVGGLADDSFQRGSMPLSEKNPLDTGTMAFIHNDRALLLFDGMVRRLDVSSTTRPRPVGEIERSPCSAYGAISAGDHLLCRANDGFASLSFTP